ncbi:nuclear transport factor 2 family protein [Sphingobacterium gobiense]|uniref:DUF4440 domain-containing protein n=1 Tax=Sphingobacterium gobiense TaxID=1382456 RepID=A0A2S9JS65_9SPHI|nr:nuclear transport factor 2 family protein [Sphingobacterium gobiense]PRD55981.1 DUF4440 domain-containing protein [Sphingobacterium gobiense]
MESEILKLEAQLIAAILSSDVKVLDQLLHDELIFVNHLGMVLSKKEDLAPHISGDLKITELAVLNQQLHLFGDTCAVVVSKNIRGIYLDQPFENGVKFTRIWKLFNEHWKVIAASSVSC